MLGARLLCYSEMCGPSMSFEIFFITLFDLTSQCGKVKILVEHLGGKGGILDFPRKLLIGS